MCSSDLAPPPVLDALARFGVDMKGLKVGGDHADAFGSAQGFTPDQRAKFEAWMDQIYNGFVTRVAEGRRLPVERVREIAKGRVWTGAQAKQLGLVDHLGGYYVAIDRAKALAKIDGEAKIKRFGGSASPFDLIGRSLGLTAASARALAASAWLLGDPTASKLMDQAVTARLRSQGASVLSDKPF